MICRRVDLSRLRIAIVLAREANQFAASSPHECSGIRAVGELTKAPDVATLIRAAKLLEINKFDNHMMSNGG